MCRPDAAKANQQISGCMTRKGWHATDPPNSNAYQTNLTFCFGEYEFQIPWDWSRNSVLIRSVFVSGTPIWIRIGQKSVLGHPFQQKVQTYNTSEFCSAEGHFQTIGL